MNDLLKERYQFIFEEKLLQEISDIALFKTIAKDVPMIDIGEEVIHIPLVLDGAIRIMKEDEKDNEYLLYYLEVGDSCAMTMSCCMGNKVSTIKAVTERKTQLILIPVQKMEDWLVKYRSWRTFVFLSYDTIMKEMLEALDALAFQNLEERLYKYLKDKAMVLHTSELEITQYQIANDLNTSRVVISRLIKKLILDKKIETHRNRVKILTF